MDNAPDQDALNYPYIRVRDVEWLKRTLLIFPNVVRMIPAQHAPGDDPDIQPFTIERGARGPLLRAARLNDSHVLDAQRGLIAGLEGLLESQPELKSIFQKDGLQRDLPLTPERSVWDVRGDPNALFQISRYKLFDDLVGFLERMHLAWEPDTSGAHGTGYLEMHPRLGQAVMSTLATACASNEGLSVVTEFPDLHSRLIGVPKEQMLSAAIFDGPFVGTTPTSGEMIAQFLVHCRCDTSALTTENFVHLRDEREALSAFRAKLEQLSRGLPLHIASESVRRERLNDAINDMFEEWRRDQANFHSFGRRFFGDGLLGNAEKLVQTLTTSALAAGVAHANGQSPLIFGGASFAVGVVFTALRTRAETNRAEVASPCRYLSVLEGEGVTFSFSR